MEVLIDIFSELITNQDTIASNQDEILTKLEDITGRLKSLDSKLDEQTLRAARTGVRHLIDGLNSDINDVKSDEFLLARREFGKLVQLDPEGTTEGTSGCVDNKHLIALGYWGNCHYFNIRGDKRNAVIQIYECTAKYPILGLILFPACFFSKDYGAVISQTATQLDEIRHRYDELSGENFWKNAWYYTKQGFVLVTAGAAGIAVATIASVLSLGISTPLIAIGTKKFYDEIEVSQPDLNDTQSLMNTINQLQSRIDDYFHELVEECHKQY
jgi:hypothetical protein